MHLRIQFSMKYEPQPFDTCSILNTLFAVLFNHQPKLRIVEISLKWGKIYRSFYPVYVAVGYAVKLGIIQ